MDRVEGNLRIVGTSLNTEVAVRAFGVDVLALKWGQCFQPVGTTTSKTDAITTG